MKGLTGKVAIVTGGGQGIGRALVLRLAEEGCKVAIFDLSVAAGEETAALAGDATVKTWQVDVSDFAAVEAAVAAVEADLGPVWVLVNNAGWDKPQPFLANSGHPCRQLSRKLPVTQLRNRSMLNVPNC